MQHPSNNLSDFKYDKNGYISFKMWLILYNVLKKTKIILFWYNKSWRFKL